MGKHSVIRNFGAAGIGFASISIGVHHFVDPIWYEPIVPSVLGDARFWVLVSGLFEVLFGLFFIIPKTRAWASVGGAWLLVVLYWANFNMWYNNIPLNGNTYSDFWHVGRLVIQITLIFSITWIGEITPFKGRERLHESLDIFKGRITSSAFESGDRIVVGAWKESIFGEFTDIMWAKKDGTRVLIAPTQEIVDYVTAMYSFDEVLLEEVTTSLSERKIGISCETMNLEFSWNRGYPIPFRRSLLFIQTIELFFARSIFSTRTYGVTKDNRKEWYAIDRVSHITSATAQIEGQDAGEFKPMKEPCKFGFSEAPKKPSSCVVRTHIL